MTVDDLCYLTARDALGLFRKRTLSPVELMQAIVRRAERINPRINAFADRYFDAALTAARRAEERYARKEDRALEGIALAVKDAQRVKGKRTTHGSLIFENAAPDDHSDPMIERLEDAGAIVFARTTVPEFCLSGVCHSRLWGVTRNPHGLDFGPGGSSGGSGAALAAGMTTIATGTDIGGSIRIPASACGVVGFKPPHGRNPDGPPACFDRYNHCGPMTRSIADAVLMQRVTAGPHPLDHDSLKPVPELPIEPASLKGFRIAYSIDFGYVPVDPEVRRKTLAALEVFRALGAEVEEVDLAWSADIGPAAMHWTSTMDYGRQTVWHRKTSAHLMTDYALKLADAIEQGSGIDDVHKAWAMAHRMYATLGPILARNEVFICPTLNLPAVKAEHDPSDPNFFVAGVKVDGENGWVMTQQFNMLHNCPVLAVPSGRAANGIPTGIQIVGPTFDDARVFQAGLAYEQAVGGWYRKDSDRPKIT
jgi:Asp-tRNA(Asn)/Glu-tRNA(Gln) amidotransferase A subunit family amidase